MSDLTGGCQCDHVRYRVTAPPLRLNLCYCTDCQRQSGSAFGMSLVIDPGALQIESGNVKTFELTADSGRKKTCGFCPECGVRIFNRTAALCSVKAGTLDNPLALQPDAQYWTRSKPAWLPVSPDLPAYDTH